MAKKNYFKIIFIFSLISSLSTGISVSGEKSKFTIGVEDYKNFLPYSDYKKGKYSGLGKEILQFFAKEKGYSFNYKVYPLKRRDLLFIDEKLDFIFPDNPAWITEQKAGKKIQYAPMLEFTDGVVVLPENKGRGLKFLKKLGVPLGFTPVHYLDAIATGRIKTISNAHYDGLYKQVLINRIDGAYVNIQITRYYQNKNKTPENDRLVFDPDLPHATGYWHLSSIKYPRIISDFNIFMEQNKKEIDLLKKSSGLTSSKK